MVAWTRWKWVYKCLCNKSYTLAKTSLKRVNFTNDGPNLIFISSSSTLFIDLLESSVIRNWTLRRLSLSLFSTINSFALLHLAFNLLPLMRQPSLCPSNECISRKLNKKLHQLIQSFSFFFLFFLFLLVLEKKKNISFPGNWIRSLYVYVNYQDQGRVNLLLMLDSSSFDEGVDETLYHKGSVWTHIKGKTKKKIKVYWANQLYILTKVLFYTVCVTQLALYSYWGVNYLMSSSSVASSSRMEIN